MICAQSGSPSTSERRPGIVQPSHTFNPFDPRTAPAGMAHRGLSHLQSVRPECRADGRGVSRDSVAPTSRVSRYGAARLLDMNGFRRARKRSEEHTSELQSLMRISYAVFCLNKNKEKHHEQSNNHQKGK